MLSKTLIYQKILELNHKLHWRIGRVKSVLLRKKRIKAYFDQHKVKKVQFGCWPYLMEGWINSDLYGSEDLMPIDLTKKLPFPDNSIDYIAMEHVIEHFDLETGIFILSEFYRVLKKKGVARVSTPNLQFLINLGKPQLNQTQKKYIEWAYAAFAPKDIKTSKKAFVINNFVRAWGHQFIYDLKTLKALGKNIGFSSVKKKTVGQSSHQALQNIENHGKSIGEAFNKLETLVVEMTK